MRKMIMSGLFAFSTLLGTAALAQETPTVDAPTVLVAPCQRILRDAETLQRDIERLQRIVTVAALGRDVQRALNETSQAVRRLENRARISRCRRVVLQRNFTKTRAEVQNLRRVFEGTLHLTERPRIAEAYRDVMRSWLELRRSLNL